MRWLGIGWYFSFLTVLVACGKSEYARIMDYELSKDGRNDSLLLGISFGESVISFRRKCEILNKQRILVQGTSSGSVRYLPMDTTLFGTMRGFGMEFKPTFDDKDGICEIELLFYHSAWSPWGSQFQAKSLKDDVLSGLINWYGGNGFIPVVLEQDTIYAKVDVNRRILVGVRDERVIKVKIQDTRHPYFKD